MCRREELGYGVKSLHADQEISMHLILSASRWQGFFFFFLQFIKCQIKDHPRKKTLLIEFCSSTMTVVYILCNNTQNLEILLNNIENIQIACFTTIC